MRPPARPRTDRQNFFAMDFREVDREGGYAIASRRQAARTQRYFFAHRPDGTLCMCSYSYQHEDSDFQAGDHVMLVVQRFEQSKQQMYGKILSKW